MNAQLNDETVGGFSRAEPEQLPRQSCRLRRGSRLAAWLGNWRNPIRSWLRNRTAARSGRIDELAQEVFLRLRQYRDDVAVNNPQGYLLRIAANVADEWQERARHGGRHDQSWLDDLQADRSDASESTLASALVRQHVQAVVDSLPPRQREILLLHVNDGLTYKQIAAHRGLTYPIVLRELTLAYSTLRLQVKVEDL